MDQIEIGLFFRVGSGSRVGSDSFVGVGSGPFSRVESGSGSFPRAGSGSGILLRVGSGSLPMVTHGSAESLSGSETGDCLRKLGDHPTNLQYKRCSLPGLGQQYKFETIVPANYPTNKGRVTRFMYNLHVILASFWMSTCENIDFNYISIKILCDK